MILTYHGHSSFKIKGKRGTVVTDPYDDSVGWSLPRLSADIVTVSHKHSDHSASHKITGTARRSNPFIIDTPGEYEVLGISVFGVSTFHDQEQGQARGDNIVFTILVDGVRVCHLGDLGHELSADQLDAIDQVDILLCPVGGHYTIGPELAVKTIRALEPGIVVPMHFQTPAHDQKTFAEVAPIETFLKEFGVDPEPVDKIELSINQVPDETQLMVLKST